MAKPRAMVDYRRCQPERCDKGICLAVLACPLKVLEQEAPYDMPDPDPALCMGCGLCVQACPLKAIPMM
jgi:translation initiation factor RLI1